MLIPTDCHLLKVESGENLREAEKKIEKCIHILVGGLFVFFVFFFKSNDEHHALDNSSYISNLA